MDFQFNCNQMVKVKLTTYGINLMSTQHYELSKKIREKGGHDIGPFELRLDRDGYYRTQMWDLMKRFGEVMAFGCENPFHLDIILIDGKPLEGDSK